MTASPTHADAAVLVSDDGPVRTLTLNRPDRRNAIDVPDRRVLLAELDAVEGEPGCRAVVLTGAGAVFCAGGDIGTMDAGPEALAERLGLAERLTRTLLGCSRPLVVAIEGGAYGMGLAIAATADVVVASRDARFGTSFGRIGLTADTGLSFTLGERIGPARAKEWILRARTVGAEEAHAVGLVDDLVEPGTALEHARSVAAELAARSAPMVAATKRISARMRTALGAVLAQESVEQMALLGGVDFVIGRAAFAERRTPRFTTPPTAGRKENG